MSRPQTPTECSLLFLCTQTVFPAETGCSSLKHKPGSYPFKYFFAHYNSCFGSKISYFCNSCKFPIKKNKKNQGGGVLNCSMSSAVMNLILSVATYFQACVANVQASSFCVVFFDDARQNFLLF